MKDIKCSSVLHTSSNNYVADVQSFLLRRVQTFNSELLWWNVKLVMKFYQKLHLV
jgi:hypothetical protein